MLAIVAGAVVLSWPGEADSDAALPALAVLGACLAWGIDDNRTRKVSLADAVWLASIKGLVAAPPTWRWRWAPCGRPCRRWAVRWPWAWAPTA